MSHRVVLVDAEQDYRLLVRLALTADGGFDVVGETGVGSEGVALMSSARPDVVLLDADPRVDGFALVSELRRAAPAALLIVLSGLPWSELQWPLQVAGSVGHISKRVLPSRLPDEIRAVGAMLQLVAGAVDETSMQLAPELTSSRQARSFVDEALQSWDCAALAGTVTLLVSELVSNAVMHAASAPEISVRLLGDRVRIEVADQDPNIPKRREPDFDSPTGRGLGLVERLASSWGIDSIVGGKRIWFEVPRPDTERPDPAAADAAAAAAGPAAVGEAPESAP